MKCEKGATKMEKYRAVFKGKKIEKIYLFRVYPSCFHGVPAKQKPPAIDHEYFDLSTETFYEDEINFEVNRGDTLYINELDENVHIEKKVKMLDGGWIYFTDYVISTVENKESKIQAEKQLREYLDESKRKEKYDNQLGNKRISFWQHLKHAFKKEMQQ